MGGKNSRPKLTGQSHRGRSFKAMKQRNAVDRPHTENGHLQPSHPKSSISNSNSRIPSNNSHSELPPSQAHTKKRAPLPPIQQNIPLQEIMPPRPKAKDLASCPQPKQRSDIPPRGSQQLTDPQTKGPRENSSVQMFSNVTSVEHEESFIGKSPGQRESLVPKPLDPQLLQQCVDILKEAARQAVKHHDEMMQQFLLTKPGAFKESEIKTYHEQTSNGITKAFIESVRPLCDLNHPDIRATINAAVKQLEAQIKSQLVVYYRKHEIATENMSKDIKMCTIDAESVYYEHMNGMPTESKTKAPLEDFHELGRQLAISKLKSTFSSKGYDFDTNKWELEDKLKENLIGALEEWEEEHRANITTDGVVCPADIPNCNSVAIATNIQKASGMISPVDKTSRIKNF